MVALGFEFKVDSNPVFNHSLPKAPFGEIPSMPHNGSPGEERRDFLIAFKKIINRTLQGSKLPCSYLSDQFYEFYKCYSGTWF